MRQTSNPEKENQKQPDYECPRQSWNHASQAYSQALARAGPWAEALKPGPWPLGGSWAQAAARCAPGHWRPGPRPGPKAQGPPKGQGSGSGPDPDDWVVTDDHDIPHVSENPKSILAILNQSILSPETLRWVLVV